MKLCIECKHYKYNPSGLDWCMLPQTTRINLVSGQHEYKTAFSLRHGLYEEYCGKTGKEFVAAEEIKEEIKQPWYKKWLKI